VRAIRRSTSRAIRSIARTQNRIHSLATDFLTLWSNLNTQRRDRKRMVRLLVDNVTLHKTDRIHLHVRFRGQTHSLIVAIPPTSWHTRQRCSDTIAALDRLLDTHTDAQTADIVVHIRLKHWTKAGILNSDKANDKNELPYQPPTAGDPRLTVRTRQSAEKRVLT
jgi:hypothetical protein